MRPAALLLAVLILSSCSRESAFEPIPAQSPSVAAPDPPSFPCLALMTQARADQFIVTGIPLGLGAGAERWTSESPAVKCKLPSSGPWNVVMDFIVAGATLRETGPITLTFTVDGQEVERLRCDHIGEYKLRAPLPAALAIPGRELVLQATVDKPWVAPSDGSKLGVLVSAMGFVQP